MPRPDYSSSDGLSLELDLARLALAGSRFDEAASKYTEFLRAKPASSEAWFGLGVARLHGSIDLQAGFAEAMLAFGHARNLESENTNSIDVAICYALLDYYSKLGEAILSLTKAARQEKNKLFMGMGLAGLSAALGTGQHANYFEQTIGVIGTVSGSRIAISSLQSHADVTSTCRFIRTHLDDVRGRFLGLDQMDPRYQTE